MVINFARVGKRYGGEPGSPALSPALWTAAIKTLYGDEGYTTVVTPIYPEFVS